MFHAISLERKKKDDEIQYSKAKVFILFRFISFLAQKTNYECARNRLMVGREQQRPKKGHFGDESMTENKISECEKAKRRLVDRSITLLFCVLASNRQRGKSELQKRKHNNSALNNSEGKLMRVRQWRAPLQDCCRAHTFLSS